jgi:hypothetical protein
MRVTGSSAVWNMNVQFMARAFRCRNSTSRAAEEARISGCTDQAREEVRKQRGIPIAALAWTRFLVFLDRERAVNMREEAI